MASVIPWAVLWVAGLGAVIMLEWSPTYGAPKWVFWLTDALLAAGAGAIAMIVKDNL